MSTTVKIAKFKAKQTPEGTVWEIEVQRRGKLTLTEKQLFARKPASKLGMTKDTGWRDGLFFKLSEMVRVGAAAHLMGCLVDESGKIVRATSHMTLTSFLQCYEVEIVRPEPPPKTAKPLASSPSAVGPSAEDWRKALAAILEAITGLEKRGKAHDVRLARLEDSLAPLIGDSGKSS